MDKRQRLMLATGIAGLSIVGGAISFTNWRQAEDKLWQFPLYRQGQYLKDMSKDLNHAASELEYEAGYYETNTYTDSDGNTKTETEWVPPEYPHPINARNIISGVIVDIQTLTDDPKKMAKTKLSEEMKIGEEDSLFKFRKAFESNIGELKHISNSLPAVEIHQVEMDSFYNQRQELNGNAAELNAFGESLHRQVPQPLRDESRNWFLGMLGCSALLIGTGVFGYMTLQEY